MITLLTLVLPLVGVVALILGMGVGMAYLNKSGKFESNRKMVDVLDDTWRSFTTKMGDQHKEVMDALRQRKQLTGTMPAGDTVRVYAVLLARGLETRLVAVPSQTFEDMIELVTKEYGLGWFVAASCYLDMEVTKKEAKAEKAEPQGKAEPRNFVSDLSYCRDVFCETPFEKRALTSVINRIKKRYALDT